MARPIRFFPRPSTTVEITQRTFQGRALLRPSERLNQLLIGCLARAQASTGARLHAIAVLSNHFHLLGTFESVAQMSNFMRHFKANLSKEVGRLYDWPGPLFGGRYSAIAVSDEPAAQEDRLRYILSQGTKEGLVASPRDWPGVHSAHALANDQPLQGIWIDRTSLYAARRRDSKQTEADFTSTETVQLVPLPCWAELTPEERRRRVEAMIAEVEDAAGTASERPGKPCLGAAAIRRRHPHTRLRFERRAQRPWFHAASSFVRKALIEGYRQFLIAYRRAAERLSAGDRTVAFPENCWPPALPFVAPCLS